jgi:hypothetical protein
MKQATELAKKIDTKEIKFQLTDRGGFKGAERYRCRNPLKVIISCIFISYGIWVPLIY